MDLVTSAFDVALVAFITSTTLATGLGTRIADPAADADRGLTAFGRAVMIRIISAAPRNRSAEPPDP